MARNYDDDNSMDLFLEMLQPHILSSSPSTPQPEVAGLACLLALFLTLHLRFCVSSRRRRTAKWHSFFQNLLKILSLSLTDRGLAALQLTCTDSIQSDLTYFIDKQFILLPVRCSILSVFSEQKCLLSSEGSTLIFSESESIRTFLFSLSILKYSFLNTIRSFSGTNFLHLLFSLSSCLLFQSFSRSFSIAF